MFVNILLEMKETAMFVTNYSIYLTQTENNYQYTMFVANMIKILPVLEVDYVNIRM
jgi:hypothetical protein